MTKKTLLVLLAALLAALLPPNSITADPPCPACGTGQVCTDNLYWHACPNEQACDCNAYNMCSPEDARFRPLTNAVHQFVPWAPNCASQSECGVCAVYEARQCTDGGYCRNSADHWDRKCAPFDPPCEIFWVSVGQETTAYWKLEGTECCVWHP